MIQNQVESVVLDELHQVLGELRARVTDPHTAEALVAMATDAAMLPVRVARGENVRSLAAALDAEAKNRALEHREAVRATVARAWERAVARLVGGLLIAAG